MEVKRGLRVVRGPDWEGGNEDGGEGYVGTVVAGARADGGAEEGRHDVATVQWDVGGERHVYRCGAEGKYDLRVIDSAPAAGVVHRHMECSGCGSESIAGCVWRCVHCLRYYLCTPCYMKDRHSVWHHFMRIDSPEKPGQRTRVRCRYQSGRVAARGVFVGARVVRGGDWRWSDQDGGAGREGTVVEIGGWQSESSRSVAVVEWRESGVKNKYRLGHKGKVDLQCRVAAEGGHYYLDHLPLLGIHIYVRNILYTNHDFCTGSAEAPFSSFICAGDRARLEMDPEMIQSLPPAIRAYDSIILQCLGMTGMVNRVDLDNDLALTIFGDEESTRVFVPLNTLKKVEGPDILPDDVVRVIDDMAEVHRLQKAGCGWTDDMALSLGQLGRMERLLDSGSAVVKVNGRRFRMDPLCLTPAPGEQLQDEEDEAEPENPVNIQRLPTMSKPESAVLLGAVEAGDYRFLEAALKKWPETVKSNFEGVALLQLAAARGRVNIVRILLQHKADTTERMTSGELPLHLAIHFNHYHIVKLLLDEGSDVNAADREGHAPIHIATVWGYYRILSLILSHPNCQIDIPNKSGETALNLSSQLFRHSVTRQLLEAGADTSMVDNQGRGPFIHAVIKGFLSGVELYLQHDPRVINHIEINDGYSALHIVSRIGDCDQLCFLAAVDLCEIDKKTYDMWTALHLACFEGNVRCVECLVGYGADVGALSARGSTPLHLVLNKKGMKPLSEWTKFLNEFHEYVSGADNSIQDVPVYITVACFLVSEGASLEVKSASGVTPLTLCPPEYRSLLQLFARPERRGHYRGSLPRYPPPVPTSLHNQRKEGNSDVSKVDKKTPEKTPTKSEATPTKSEATPTRSEATPTKSEATPTKSEATPNRSEATPPEVSVSGGDSNKTKESEVDSVTGPSCFLCEGPCDITFQPCGHTAMCAECAQPVKRCPTCKTPIANKIKIITA